MKTIASLLPLFCLACAPDDSPPQRHPGPCAVYLETDVGRDLAEETEYEGNRPVTRRAYAQGRLRRTWRWSYTDHVESLESVERDEPAGPLRWTRVRSRNRDGHWVEESLDLGSNGTVDETRLRDYHDGVLQLECHFRGARSISCTTHTRPGARETHEAVVWSDGGADAVVRHWDTRGRLLEEAVDFGADGAVDRRSRTRWDATGRSEWETDYDGDGHPELRGVRHDDGCGFVELEDLDGDDLPDRERHFDCDRYLVKEAYPQERRTFRYSYSCF